MLRAKFHLEFKFVVTRVSLATDPTQVTGDGHPEERSFCLTEQATFNVVSMIDVLI